MFSLIGPDQYIVFCCCCCFKFIYLFIFGFVGSLLRCTGFSLWWLFLLQSTGSRRAGLSSCGTWAQQLWHVGSVVVARGLQNTGSVVWHMDLVALRHVGSSRTRARTHVPCIGRRILNHCATREAQISTLLIKKMYVVYLKF